MRSQRDTHLRHCHLLKSHFLQHIPPFTWPAAAAVPPRVCKLTEDAGPPLPPPPNPPGLDARQRDISSDGSEGCAAAKRDASERVLSVRAALRLQRSGGGGRRGRSKVVPLLPERLLTFMNRAFTPEFSPAGRLLCALYKSVGSHAATGDVSRGTAVPSCSCRKNSFPLFAASIPLSRPLFKNTSTLESFSLFFFFNVGTAAAIYVSLCRVALHLLLMFPIILKHPQGCMEFGLAIHNK